VNSDRPDRTEARDANGVDRLAAPGFVLDELFRGRPAEEWRAIYAGAFDRGPDVGRETVEE
jgi:hypothetical protein